jgi:hypothetical protein
MLERYLKPAACLSLGFGVAGIAARVHDARGAAVPPDPATVLKADFMQVVGTAMTRPHEGFLPAPPSGPVEPLGFRVIRVIGG